MCLLHSYFKVGGEYFDGEKFSLAAEVNGFVGGTFGYVSNTHKLTRTSTSGQPEEFDRKILSGITGTNGEGYSYWQSAPDHYVEDRAEYEARLAAPPMSTEWVQTWLREEEMLLAFLKVIKEKLPPVAEFCKGEYFLLLRPIYGYDAEDPPGGGQHYSDNLFKALCELGAGLSTDSQEI